MIQLLDALKDVPLISLDISETGCGGPTGAKLVEIVSADTQLGVTIEELQFDGDTSAMEQLSETCERNKASPKTEQVDIARAALVEFMENSGSLLSLLRTNPKDTEDKLKTLISAAHTPRFPWDDPALLAAQDRLDHARQLRLACEIGRAHV